MIDDEFNENEILIQRSYIFQWFSFNMQSIICKKKKKINKTVAMKNCCEKCISNISYWR